MVYESKYVINLAWNLTLITEYTLCLETSGAQVNGFKRISMLIDNFPR